MIKKLKEVTENWIKLKLIKIPKGHLIYWLQTEFQRNLMDLGRRIPLYPITHIGPGTCKFSSWNVPEPFSQRQPIILLNS